MKKPAKTAPAHVHQRYKEWVRAQLKDWDPQEDHHPGCYIPRHNGVRGDEVEQIEVEYEPSDDD